MPHFDVNGTSIHYHVQGKGPAIVLIHPPFLGLRVFNYLRTDLSRNHRVVVFDVRGHGHSGSGAAKLTVPLIAEDMKRLLDSLDIGEAYVCGYSVGAMPALEALLAYPGRFKGGIMLSGMSELTDRLSRAMMRAASFATRLQAKDAVALPIALGNADSRTTLRVLHKEANAGEARRHHEYIAACLAYSCTRRMRAIGVPVLLVCGGKNPAFIRYARMMSERLADAELHIVDGARHQLPTKAPDRTAAAIRAWIARQEGCAVGEPRTINPEEVTEPAAAPYAAIEQPQDGDATRSPL